MLFIINKCHSQTTQNNKTTQMESQQPTTKASKSTIMGSPIQNISTPQNNFLPSSFQTCQILLLEYRLMIIQLQYEMYKIKQQQLVKQKRNDCMRQEIDLISFIKIIIDNIKRMRSERGEDIELMLKTKKENNSGILSNERLLMIKAGIISYFSEAPKKFTGSSKFLQTSGQFPKYTIRANDIDHMDLKGGTLSMLFKKSKLISKNQFQDMVKKKDYQPDRASEISVNQELSGFVKWNFQCDNQEQLKEFYRYTNLFRVNNPKFVPSLTSVISTFRGQKKPQQRQMSMKPASSQKIYQNDFQKQRLSQVVPTSSGKDLFMQILDKSIENKEQPKQQRRSIEAKPSRNSQSQRLNKLKNRISTMHLPMERIDQRQNQDKLSEISRQPIETNLKRTFSEVVEQIQTKNDENVSQKQEKRSLIHQLQQQNIPQVEQVKKVNPKQTELKEEKPEQKIPIHKIKPQIKQQVIERKEQPKQDVPKQEELKLQEPKQQELKQQQALKDQPKQEEPKKELIIQEQQPPEQKQEQKQKQQQQLNQQKPQQKQQPPTLVQILIEVSKIIQPIKQLIQPKQPKQPIQPIKPKQSIQPKELIQLIQPIQPIQSMQPIQPTQLEKEQELPKQRKAKMSQIPLLNKSYDIQSNNTEQQSTKKKHKKLHQFLKATTYIDNFDPKQVCKNLSISLQHLQQLMKQHSRQEQSPWIFIQNNLAYQLNKKNNVNSRIKISDEVVKEYYQLGEQNYENYQFLKIPLQGEISYIAPQAPKEEEVQALRWMEEQIKNTTPKAFSTKIINKTHFKVYIRQIDFKRQSIKHIKGGWIVNRHGYLEQFLAYLRLEKVLKELNSSNDLELILAETIYLRYKQFQGIGKEWRDGYPFLPIKSIKSLEYITRSKEMQYFYRDYPQFNIIIQIIKQGHKYRLHLERITNTQQPIQDQEVVLHELKKLIFPFDNQLDLFYQNEQYTNIQSHCLQEIDLTLKCKQNIDKEDLYSIMETMENNISVDTLCKILGCRIDKKGNIYFYHTILRLGERQFGQQISLIKRWKKKGNIEMGRQLSKRLMGKLHEYQTVTPISHFIEIYLHIIDFMIVNEGELHRVIPILLKVLTHLGQSEVEQYPIYLALMKTYLKLGQMQNFIKTLQNCRLFICEMFKQFSPLLDYSLQRIIIIVMLKQDPQRALNYSYKLLRQIEQNTYFPESIKEKYMSKLEWDKNNILLSLGQHTQAFSDCFKLLSKIQEASTYYPDYWIEGVLCLSRCWLSIQQTNSINSAQLQKRIGCAIELAFSRQNLEMVFVLFQTGMKVLNRCQQLDLPILLSSQSAFEQAKIQFNQTQTQIFYTLSQNN